MNDSFLDRFGAELADAERALSAAGARRRRRRRATRRSVLIAVCALAVAGSALAATRPWQPILGRPHLHDVPGSTSTSPVPQAAVDLLAVLRRPQDERDRGPVVQRLLRGLGRQFAGVRLDSVRLVSSELGHDALVVSTEQAGSGVSDTLCVVFTSGVNCGNSADAQSGRFFMTTGQSVRGLAPDGVARVLLTFAGGETLSTAVHDNVFWVSDTPAADSGPSTPPAGASAPAPMAMTASFAMTWLDAHGRAVGPPLKRRPATVSWPFSR